ncbi:MAG: DsbA family protein [Candidatus Kuenenbacteria bacterium]
MIEEKKQADENIALKNVSQKKSLFEDVSPKLTFILGLIIGIAVFSLIGFFSLLFIEMQKNQTIKEKNLAENKEFVPNIKPPTTPPPSENPQTIKTATFEITKNDHIRGNFNAPISLVVFSDFQCSYCSRFKETIDETLKNYKDKVRIIFKHFPLSFHQNAQKAAETSECANEQGKFWEYHDKLFANQEQFSIDNFKQWAKELKLDSKKFDDCIDSGKYSEKVKKDLAEGQSKGVEGTPATFVNGKLVSGALPFENFKSIIDLELSK